MLVLSALPIYPEGSPLSPQIMEETRRIAEGLCRDERVLLHAQALPNIGRPQAALDSMEEAAKRYPIVAWKTFTHFPDFFEHNDQAWWLDDHDPSLPQVGDAFIRKAVDLGLPTICTHKGFSGGSAVRLAAGRRSGRQAPPGGELRHLPLGVRGRRRRGPVHAGDARTSA